jgi:hypothetical protein
MMRRRRLLRRVPSAEVVRFPITPAASSLLWPLQDGFGSVHLSVADEFDDGLVADFPSANGLEQARRVGDTVSIKAGDHVSGLQPCRGGRAAGDHLRTEKGDITIFCRCLGGLGKSCAPKLVSDQERTCPMRPRNGHGDATTRPTRRELLRGSREVFDWVLKDISRWTTVHRCLPARRALD